MQRRVFLPPEKDSGDLKQLLGGGGTRDTGKGQSVAYWAGCSSSSSSTSEFYSLEGSLANAHLAVFCFGDELQQIVPFITF